MEPEYSSECSLDTSADFFANSSTETVAENEECKVETLSQDFPPAPVMDDIEMSILSDTSKIINNIIEGTETSIRIYCPFCSSDFESDILLKDHIKQHHSKELKIVFSSKSNEFHQCPFCQAKFYSFELLPKHILRKHELCVVNMFSGFSPEKYIYCRFCPHKIMRKHYKLLIIHIEKKHYQAFENYVLVKYSNKIYEDCDKTDTYASPGISGVMAQLTSKNQDSPSVKSILKPKTAYPVDITECLVSKEIQTYANITLPVKTSKRKLRFHLPEEKENVPAKKQKLDKKTRLWNFYSKKKNIKKQETDSSDENLATQLCKFQCGICYEYFDINEKLIEHIKNKHKGLTLQARYRCGHCHEKFFRNSYLIKHCWSQHGPLCLKNLDTGGQKSTNLF